MALLKSVQRKFFHLVRLLIAMLLLIAPLAWLSISHPQHLQSIGSIVSQNTPWFMAFRWLLILLLWLFWPFFVKSLSMRQLWPTEKAQFWYAQRWKIVIWLMLFELVVCENVFLAVLHLLERL